MAYLQQTVRILAVILPLLVTISAQAQPQVTASGLFIVGREKTLACNVTTDEATNSFPLTWSRGGSNLAASEENTVDVSGSTKNYNSLYRFTVQPSDNLALFICTAHLPSGTMRTTWTVYVQKAPDDPAITGPTTVASDVGNTWTCLVDGASTSSPNVYWELGNGTRLSSENFNNTLQVYRDPSYIDIHKVTSVLTRTLPAGTPPSELVCLAVHFETESQKRNRTSVTVLDMAVSTGPGPTNAVQTMHTSPVSTGCVVLLSLAHICYHCIV